MTKTALRSEQDCEDFVRGLCFLATGGSGGRHESLRLLLDQLNRGREIEFVDAATLPEEAWTVTAACIGGRIEEGDEVPELTALGCTGRGKGHLDLILDAIQVLQNHAGIELAAVVPVEISDLNVAAPVAAAMELGLPVVDGDYSGGRAAPEIAHGIPEIRGRSVCPISYTTRWGDAVIVTDTASTGMVDRIGRMLNIASHGWLGSCWDLMPAGEAREYLAPGTQSKALAVGRTIRRARETGADPVMEAVKAVNGWLLFRGEVVAADVADGDSLDFGSGAYELAGLGDFAGHTFRIWYKNEYHVSWRNGEPLVSSPDSLIMVHLETGEPATSFDVSMGDRLAVIGCQAYQGLRSRAAIDAYHPRHFGFDTEYVPIENLVGESTPK
jgi:DUF917 family protein